MLDSGTPKVNIGTASPYALGNLTVNVNGGGKRREITSKSKELKRNW